MTSASETSVTAVRPPIPAHHLTLFVTSFAILTAIATLCVFMSLATDEPYFSFRPQDAVVLVGFGSVLVAAWFTLIATVCYGVFTRRLGAVWLLLLIVAGIGLLYSRLCVIGYLNDIVRNVLPR
jgi:hypothetical protein